MEKLRRIEYTEDGPRTGKRPLGEGGIAPEPGDIVFLRDRYYGEYLTGGDGNPKRKKPILQPGLVSRGDETKGPNQIKAEKFTAQKKLKKEKQARKVASSGIPLEQKQDEDPKDIPLDKTMEPLQQSPEIQPTSHEKKKQIANIRKLKHRLIKNSDTS